ncbi:MAG TPA: cytochrome c-type biogenesis protein [Gaiella sp.]|nr:cytochrome c-type biogenesis protein [Gaiella sp.]
MIRALAFWALVAALVAGASTAAPSPADLEAELVCPVCGTTLDQSDAPIAQRMKRYIRQRLAAGASEKQIKAELVDQFGPGVLAEPPKSGFNLLAWLVPLGIGVLGAAFVAVLAVAWSRRRTGDAAEPELDPELERRLDAELRRFEQ